MENFARWVSYGTLLGVFVFVSWLLMISGLFGLTLFLVMPLMAGAIGAVCFESKNIGAAAKTGGITAAAGCLLFLFIGIEGLLCIVMSLPLAFPLGACGGALAHSYLIEKKGAPVRMMLLLVPLGGGSLGWDVTAAPPVRPVVTAIEIAAPPEAVWPNILEFPDLDEPQEWCFRAGIAYPKRARIVDGVRYCEFSTGPFVEPITVRDEPRLLAFRVTGNPAPMEEFSIWGHIEPKHLHGYMESEKGEFRLIPISGGRATRLQGTTWYRHGLWPDMYWRLWSDEIIHRIHLRVLRHIQKLSETPRP